MSYVLIHGGGSTGRYWDRLLPFLDQPALAVDLPGRNGKEADLATLTVDQEVASVVADVVAARASGVLPDEPVVVVAHSSGGLVVPGVVVGLRAAGVPVAQVVLNAALVPPEGGCGLDCMKPGHAAGLRMTVAQAEADGTTITLPGPPPDPEPFRVGYGGEPLDDAALAYMVDPVRCVADTVHHYFQPVHWSTAAEVRVTYIVNDRDRPVRTPMQEEMIGRLPVPPDVLRIDGGHIPAVTAPEAFAALLASISSP